jgi:steroid 5-alpha reductase family enzyme
MYLNGLSVSIALVASLMFALWISSIAIKDASIIDRFWGVGFVLISFGLTMILEGGQWNQTLLLAIVSIWGIRLSIFIHNRNKGHPEDYRYVEMRKKAGPSFWWRSLIRVFMLQGVIMLIVATPLIYCFSMPSGAEFSATLTIIGSIVWSVGFVFEAGGDWQLSRFKSDPRNKGQLLNSGLWSLSRHPNYFGDACQWWGFGLFALAYGIEASWTLLGPAVMTFFIRKISGVDLLEKGLKSSKPGYEDYIKTVPAFIPNFTKIWRK